MLELKVGEYRAAMVEKRYQAQFKCGDCNGWVLTETLEAFKNKAGEMLAEAKDTMCEQTGCGKQIGTVRLIGWPYSAPVKWRK